jgi:hypothetical protein
MKRNHVFEATDGTTFPTAEECKKYEGHLFLAQLCDLSNDQVEGATNYAIAYRPISDAIERAGSIIAAKRRESGELKRAPKRNASEQAMENIKKNMKAIS